MSSSEAHRKVALLGGLLLVLMAVVGVVGALSVRSIERDLTVLVDDDGRVLAELHSVHLLVVQAQLALEQAVAPTSTTTRAEQLEEFDAVVDAVVREWASLAESDDGAAPDEAIFDSWVVAISELRAELETGTNAASIDEARLAFDELSGAFEDGLVPLATEIRATGSEASDRARLAHLVLLVVAGVGLGVGGLISRSSFRAVRAQQRSLAQRDTERAREASRTRVEGRIGRALDYARTDVGALAAAERALQQLCPDRPTELLLADSSRAHFEVPLRTHRDAGLPGCGVATPNDCPAVSSGQTLQFITSRDFDACPHLHDRPSGPLSAVCIPVSISGTSEGVLHSTGPDQVEIEADVAHALGVVTHRLGERIGVLRAFRQSQLQAATDPLTGLANRRSFENVVAARLAAGQQIAIAFGDIDHFKQLNDTYGHDTGDRALRTFARLVRDVIRPNDLICRWGGEEFVAAFSGLDATTAADVLERLRAELAVLVAAGSIPGFTVSFGIADRRNGDTLDEMIQAADRALLTAKRTGRNRIVLADDPACLATDLPANRHDGVGAGHAASGA